MRQVVVWLVGCVLAAYANAAALAKDTLFQRLLSDREKVDLSGDGKPDRFNIPGPEGTVVVRKTDIDGDGKVDIIDYFDNRGEFYKREISSRQNGRIDTWITFESSGRVFKEFDLNQDGKVDKTEESQPNGDRIFIRIRSNLDKSPELVREVIQNVPAMQPDEKESDAHILDRAGRAVTVLKDALDDQGELKPLGEAKGGLRDTSYGFRLEDRCVEFFGEKGERLNRILYQTLAEGVACLWELGEEVKRPPNHPKFHIAELGSLLLDKAKPPKLYCEEMAGAGVHEARASSSKIPLDNAHPHPSIILNLKPLANAPETWIKRTVFHELFHNLGQEHGVGIEYAYACSNHCFPDETRPDLRPVDAQMKNICKGEYKEGEEDPKYLADLSAAFTALGQFEFLKKAIMNTVQRHPENLLLPVILAESSIDPLSSPFGYAWTGLVDRSKLSRTQKKRLDAAREVTQGYVDNEGVPVIKMFYDGAGAPLARSFDALLKKDNDKAFDWLAKVKYPSLDTYPADFKDTHQHFVLAMRGIRWHLVDTLEATNAFRLNDLEKDLQAATQQGKAAEKTKIEAEIAKLNAQQQRLRGDLKSITYEPKR